MTEFSSQSVRDLVWTISSPPIIFMEADASAEAERLWPQNKWYEQIYEESLPWLRRLDKDSAELDELLARQKDRRLGKYFETLWYFWLERHPRYQVIDNNLQIIIDGETLGEMDFIVFDTKTKQTQHWELAVKFYLGVGDSSKMNHWHGPGLRDRLDLKVEHLLHRQSVISHRPRVARWLKQRGLKIDRCVIILKGRLYYPWQQKVLANVISPPQCDVKHLRSWWLTQSQFDNEVADSEKIISLFNEGWLERISTGSVKKFDSKKTIFENMSNKIIRYPLHLQLCDARHSWDRVFLTEDSWPSKKT